MTVQEKWYNSTDSISKPTGTGVYIRKNGTVVELNGVEVRALRKKLGREPVRVSIKETDNGRSKR